jgi:hypothetical protein
MANRAALKRKYERASARQQLESLFGGIGEVGQGGRAHFDYEKAALASFDETFDPDLPCMCMFHFGQCICRYGTVHKLRHAQTGGGYKM